MSDNDYLKWIAEHLVMFRPAFTSAYVEYIDDAGFQQSFYYISPNNLGDDTTALLKECVDESMRETRKQS